MYHPLLVLCLSRSIFADWILVSRVLDHLHWDQPAPWNTQTYQLRASFSWMMILGMSDAERLWNSAGRCWNFSCKMLPEKLWSIQVMFCQIWVILMLLYQNHHNPKTSVQKPVKAPVPSWKKIQANLASRFLLQIRVAAINQPLCPKCWQPWGRWQNPNTKTGL